MAESNNWNTERNDEEQRSIKSSIDTKPEIYVTNENIRDFIHFEDALVWNKFLRIKHEIDLPDVLMKDKDNFSDRLVGITQSECSNIYWPRTYTNFLRFKKEFQDIDVFLTPKDIKDLFDEPRFVNYCWVRLLSHSINRDNGLFKRYYIEERRLSRGVSINDYTNKLRLESIVRVIQTAEMSVKKKKVIILDWHNQWLKHKFPDISWLDINDEVNNEWILGVLAENNIGSVKLEPCAISECYSNILMLLDSEGDTHFIKGLVSKLRKSLSQRKYRAKNQDLKYYSIAMTAETKQKLDSIVIDQDTKIHRVIERLINQEYNKK